MNSFHFAKEIFEQQPNFFLISLFTNILLEETSKICQNKVFKECETIVDLTQIWF